MERFIYHISPGDISQGDTMFKSHIKLMVLKHLNRETLSGYDLMNYLGNYSSKPSPGYIYPLLKDLQMNGFISVKEDGRRKIYSITQKGKKLLENLKNKHQEMMKTLASMGDKNEIKEFIRLKSSMKKSKCIIRNRAAFEDLRKMISLVYNAKSDEKKVKMEKILEEAIKKMESIE